MYRSLQWLPLDVSTKGRTEEDPLTFWIETSPSGGRPPERTWGQTSYIPPVNRQMPQKTLPSLVVGNYSDNIENLCRCRQERMDPKRTYFL